MTLVLTFGQFCGYGRGHASGQSLVLGRDYGLASLQSNKLQWNENRRSGSQPLNDQEFQIIKSWQKVIVLHKDKNGCCLVKKWAFVLLTSQRFWILWIVQNSSF